MSELHEVLRATQNGDSEAAGRLAVLLYEELRAMAEAAMAGERRDHTLQATAVVHEAYLRLVGPDGSKGGELADRQSFCAAAATAIRRVLVDHARARSRDKRSGSHARVELDGLDVVEPLADGELLRLDEALAELARLDPHKARLVELRFFSGLSVADLAHATGKSESTLQREWRMARAWLRARMEEDHGR